MAIHWCPHDGARVRLWWAGSPGDLFQVVAFDKFVAVRGAARAMGIPVVLDDED